MFLCAKVTKLGGGTDLFGVYELAATCTFTLVVLKMKILKSMPLVARARIYFS